MWLGSNGVRLRCPRCCDQGRDRDHDQDEHLEAEEEARQPRRHADAADHHDDGTGGDRTLKMPHGTFQSKYFSTVMDRKPPDTASTEETAIM